LQFLKNLTIKKIQNQSFTCFIRR